MLIIRKKTSNEFSTHIMFKKDPLKKIEQSEKKFRYKILTSRVICQRLEPNIKPEVGFLRSKTMIKRLLSKENGILTTKMILIQLSICRKCRMLCPSYLFIHAMLKPAWFGWAFYAKWALLWIRYTPKSLVWFASAVQFFTLTKGCNSLTIGCQILTSESHILTKNFCRLDL